MAEQAERGADRRRWRRIGAIVGGVVVLLLLAVVLAPTILSTPPGKRVVLAVVDQYIAGSVTADRIRLAWFRGQLASDVRLMDPQGDEVLHAPLLDAPQLRLLPLIFGSSALGEITLQLGEVQLTQQRDEPTNLEQALEIQDPPFPLPALPEPDPDEPTQLDPDLSTQLSFSAERVSYEGPDIERVELTGLSGRVDIPDIDRIALTLESDLEQAGETGRIDAEVVLSDAFTPDGQPRLMEAQMDVAASVANLPLAMVDRLAQQEGRLLAAVGPQLSAELEAAGRLETLSGRMNVQSEHLQAQLNIESDADALRASDSTVTWRMTPALWGLVMEGPAPAELVEPFTTELSLTELVLPRLDGGFDWEGGVVALEGTVSDVVLDVEDQPALALRGTELALGSENLAERIAAQLSATAEVGEVSEPVQASATVERLAALFEPDGADPVRGNVTATALPMVLADTLAEQEGRLVRLVGETLDASVDMQRTPAGDMSFAGRVESPNIEGPFTGGQTADGLITFQTPSPIAVRLTPEAYLDWAGVDGETGVVLDEATTMQLNVDDLRVAMLEAQGEAAAEDDAGVRLDPERTGIIASVDIPALRLRNQATGVTQTVEQGSLQLQGPEIGRLLIIDFEATLEQIMEELAAPALDGAAEPGDGSVSSRTEIEGLLDEAGHIQPAHATISSRTEAIGLASGVVTGFAGAPQEVGTALGPWVSAVVELDYAAGQGGPVRAEVNSPNLDATVPGMLDGEWVLGLGEDAQLSLNVTPEVGAELLTAVNPFLEALSAERPIAVRINASDFSVPLRDFAIERMRASAVADIGTLRLRQGPAMRAIVTALNAVRADIGIGREFDATFTPATLAMADGVLSYDRMEMEAGNLVMGVGGRVNYATDQMNLSADIPGRSLTAMVSELGRVLEPNDRVTIPLRGRVGEAPEIDSAAFQRELVQLAAEAGARELVPEEMRGIFDVFRGRQPQRPDEDEPEDEEEEPEEEEQRRPGLRDLFDRIR